MNGSKRDKRLRRPLNYRSDHPRTKLSQPLQQRGVSCKENKGTCRFPLILLKGILELPLTQNTSMRLHKMHLFVSSWLSVPVRTTPWKPALLCLPLLSLQVICLHDGCPIAQLLKKTVIGRKRVISSTHSNSAFRCCSRLVARVIEKGFP